MSYLVAVKMEHEKMVIEGSHMDSMSHGLLYRVSGFATYLASFFPALALIFLDSGTFSISIIGDSLSTSMYSRYPIDQF